MDGSALGGSNGMRLGGNPPGTKPSGGSVLGAGIGSVLGGSALGGGAALGVPPTMQGIASVRL